MLPTWPHLCFLPAGPWHAFKGRNIFVGSCGLHCCRAENSWQGHCSLLFVKVIESSNKSAHLIVGFDSFLYMNLFFENGICLTRTPVTTSAYKLQHLLLTMSRQCFDCAWSPKNMTSLVPEAGHNSIRFWQKSRVFFQVLIRISLTNIFGMSCSKYWVRAPSWAFYCILTHPRILLARDWSVSNTWCMTTSEKTKHMRIADVSPQVVIPLLHCSLTILDSAVPLLN